MNMNDRAKVVLTDLGLEVYRDHFRKAHADAIEVTNPSRQADIYDEYYKDDATRTERVFESSLWNIMNIFGGCLKMGFSVPFKDNEITFAKGK